eukprot:3614319-Rhodomonas_salina.1
MVLSYADDSEVYQLGSLRTERGYLPACVEEAEAARERLVEHHHSDSGGAKWGARGPEVRGVLWGRISSGVRRPYRNLVKMALMFVGA